MCVNFLVDGLIFIENISTKRLHEIKNLLLNVLEVRNLSVVCKKYINMDQEFFDENLLLLLFHLLKFRKLRKSKCKKIYIYIYIRRRPPKFWVQNIFNYNLQQNVRFLQHSSRHYLPRQKQPPEVFCKKRCSWKFHKIHRKTPVLESLF